MNYFLGIDVGTTHAKAVIVDAEGNSFFETKKGYPLLRPHPGYEEQDAVQIMAAVEEVIRKAVAAVPATGRIVSACFSAAMHSILPVDKNGIPLYHALIWADTRSKEEAEAISLRPDAEQLYARTGIPIHPMSPLCKIVWFKKKLPTVFEKAARFISIKEYIFYCLFGKHLIDWSLATATGLFNLQERKWDTLALEVAGIDESRLSLPVSTLHAEQKFSAAYEGLMNTTEEIPFIIGSSDGCMANLGSGAIGHGDTALTIGTSGAVRMTVWLADDLLKNSMNEEKLFTYPLADDLYVKGGAINNGGIVLGWLAELFPDNGEKDYEELLKGAASVPPGAEGLLFLPYLLGERAPVWDADAKGALIGLAMKHKKEHVVRASLEGICFTLCQIIEKLEKKYGRISEVYMSGGVVRSAFWVQLMADITGKKINVTDLADASATGAAFLGMYKTGHIHDLAEVKRFIHISETHKPDSSHYEIYRKLLKIFDSLYPKLKDDFAALSRLQEN